jgi:hypothetical protein
LITLSFEDQLLHDACTDLGRAERLYGRVEAEDLVTLISDALALENARELIDLHGGIIIQGNDSLHVPIGADYHAAIVPVGTRFGRSDDGRVVWETVTRLKLVEVSRLP